MGELTTFSLDSTVLRFPGIHVDVDSLWSVTEAGGLLLNYQATWEGLGQALVKAIWDCQIGDLGTYSFTLSPDSQTLTLHAARDACAQRALILEGDWTRWPCYCAVVSAPSPGRHAAQIFKPFDDGSSGEFSFDLPAGWGIVTVPPTWPDWEHATDIRIAKVGDYFSAIRLFSNSVAQTSQESAQRPGECVESGPRSGTSATDVAGWLSSLNDLDSSVPQPVAIGGLAGVRVDVHLISGGTACHDRYRKLFQGHGPDADEIGIAADHWATLIILDRGDGQILVISLEAVGQEGWSALIADAMPVIDSFEFTR